MLKIAEVSGFAELEALLGKLTEHDAGHAPQRPGVDIDTLTAGWARGHWDTAHDLAATLCISPEAAKLAVVSVAAHGSLTPTALRAIAGAEELRPYPVEVRTLLGLAETAELHEAASRHTYASGWVAEAVSSHRCELNYEALLAVVVTALHVRGIWMGLPEGKIHTCGDHGPDSPQCLVAAAAIAYFASTDEETSDDSPEETQESPAVGLVPPVSEAATDPSPADVDGQPEVEHGGQADSLSVSGTSQYSDALAA